MGGWISRHQLSAAEEQRLARKCRSLSQAHSRCLKANPDNTAACTNLQTSLVMCYASDLCKEAAAAHEKCYMSIINKGIYNGKRDCEATVKVMQACLRKYKLYPSSPAL